MNRSAKTALSGLVLNTNIDFSLDIQIIARRASLLLSQILHGFGYYGQPRNYVPLLNYRYFKDELRPIIQDAVNSEAAFDCLITKAEQSLTDDQAFQGAAQRIADTISGLRSQKEGAIDQANALVDVIVQLGLEVREQKERLLAAQDRFNKAVEFATDNGCGPREMLDIIAVVITVVAAVYTGGTSLYATGALIASKGFELYETVNVKDQNTQQMKETTEFNPVYKQLDTAQGEIKDVVAKYNKMKALLRADPDSSRVVLPKDEFDHLASDIESKIDRAPIPQEIKEDFKLQTHKYVDLVQARNNKILERDGCVLKVHDLDQQIQEGQLHRNHVEDLRARAAIPEKNEYAAFLRANREALRRYMRRLIWEEIRALALWQMQPIDAFSETRLEGLKAVDLMNTHDQLSAQFLITAASLPSGRQSIDPKIRITKEISRADAQQFARTGRFSFSIGLNDEGFEPFMKEITVTSVIVEVIGVVGFSGQLEHSGRQLFRRTSGDLLEFASYPLAVGLQTSPVPLPVELGGSSGNYIGVSPCSQWILTYTGRTSATLVNAKEIQLAFGGFYRSSLNQ